MATKTQQLVRYENGRYRDRRTPTVDPIRAPRSPGLPAVPVNWFPKQSQALGFAQKLLGAAPVITSLMKTEAGEQYKEARARAMRGDFTIDDSGLFTFTAEQQRALSEVEGTLDADQASAELRLQAREWQQELAENEALTPADRVALFTQRVREASYGSLSNTRDSDYLIAKGNGIHRTASALIGNYTSQTVRAELEHEQSMTGQVLSNRLAEMPSELTPEEETAFRTQALTDFYRNWTRITGQSIRSDGAKAQIKPMLMDLIASGDVESLERLKDMKFPDGSTLEGMGLINKSVLESAVRQADKLEEDAIRQKQRIWRDNQQLYGSKSVDFYGRTLQLSGLNAEEKSNRISEIVSGIDETMAELSALPDDAMEYQGKQRLLTQLDQYRSLAIQGGPQEELPESARKMLFNLVNTDYEAALPLLREYSQYRMPTELSAPMREALSYNDAIARQGRERQLWMTSTLAEVRQSHPEYQYNEFNIPVKELSWEETREYAKAQSLLSSAYDRITQEHPEWSLEERRAEAEKVLFSRFERLNPEQSMELQTIKESLRQAETVNPSTDPEDLVRLSASFAVMDPANKRRFAENLMRNPALDHEQKATVQALLSSPDAEQAQGQIITTEESIRMMEQADPNNPKQYFGRHGNKLFKPMTTLSSHRILVLETTESGGLRVVEKEPNAVSSIDKPLTGLYPSGARIVRGTEIVPISELSEERDLALLDQQSAPINPDPGVPVYNPNAYPDNEIPRPTVDGALFGINLTNRNKPLDDHMVICKVPGDFPQPTRWTPKRNGNVVVMKRYGDCTEEMKKNIVSAPFDPDYRVLVNVRGKYQVVQMRNYLSSRDVSFVTSEPVDFMSAKEQIKLLMEE